MVIEIADDFINIEACTMTNILLHEPWNFSWVIRDELCAMSCPSSEAQLRYLTNIGVNHLVTLSRDKQPPHVSIPELQHTLIDVTEFEPPSIAQIQRFIDICDYARVNEQIVGVHCRMGRGRTGVMAACHLVHFYEQTPERAITNIRLMRPGSVETYSQEKAVAAYYDFLCSSK